MNYFAILVHAFTALGFISKKNALRKTIGIIACLIICFIPASLMLSDYLNYQTYFNQRFSFPAPYNSYDYEPGFYLLNKWWKASVDEFFSLRYFIIVVILTSKLWIISVLSKSWFIGLLCYLSLLFYADSYLLRSSLASVFLAMSFFLLVNKRELLATVLCFVATSFHYSAATFLVIILFSRLKFSKYVFAASFFVILAFAFFDAADKIFSTVSGSLGLEVLVIKYELYAASEMADAKGLLRGSVMIFSFIFFWFLFQANLNSHLVDITLKTTLLGLLFLVGFSGFGILADRVFRLFGFAFCIAISLIFDGFEKNSNRLIAVIVSILAFNSFTYLTSPSDLEFIVL